MSDEKKKTVVLDGKEVTQEQLQEAKSKPSVKIIEDKKNPGQYKTLKRMNG